MVYVDIITLPDGRKAKVTKTDILISTEKTEKAVLVTAQYDIKIELIKD